MAALELDQIVKHFTTPTEPLVVLDGVSFSMQPGENLAICGPSGCGKSTLLHLIGGLDQPTSGSVTLGGQCPHDLSEPELAAYRNREIGFVFQDHLLLPQLPAIENVLLPALATGSNSPELTQRAKALLHQVGLSDRLAHRPGQLSGGECQRVAVARALILKPSLLLADEPTGNLDPETAQSIGRMLVEIQKQENAMLIAVTHSMAFAKNFDRMARLENGQLNEPSVNSSGN